MMCEDNVEAGVVLTMTTMTTKAMTTPTGIAAEMPDGVRDELKALLQRDEAGFAPLGDRGPPWTSFMIRGQRLGGRRRRRTTTTTIRERGTGTRGRENDDDDYDYNCTGRGRRNAEGR
jgi:hypothetical protein